MSRALDAIWARPRAKRWLNHAYLYAIQWLHLALDLSPWFLRNLAWRLLLRECGPGVYFDHRVYVKFPWLVSIGSDVSINRGAEFYCGLREASTITIGSNVRIAPNVRFHAAGHDPDDPGLRDNGAPIVVESDAWIGAGSVVLQGVRIGRGAVVAAGSVVTRDVPPWSIAAGVPARVVRERRVPHASR
jgi:maltose O-acetyltransferase